MVFKVKQAHGINSKIHCQGFEQRTKRLEVRLIIKTQSFQGKGIKRKKKEAHAMRIEHRTWK